MSDATQWSTSLGLRWFLVGVGCAAFLIATQAVHLGGLAGLLEVGEGSALRTTIEAELGAIPISDHGGHDGQIFYAIGLDPWGTDVASLLDHPGYRYRRILYPALASLGGALEGPALLASMAVISALALGLASASLRYVIYHFGLSVWAMLGLLANPGVWYGARLLTSDTLAIALGLLGVALILTGKARLAIIALGGAALSKEPYLLIALGLAGWLWSTRQRRAALFVAAVPAFAVLAWGGLVAARLGGGLSAAGNLSLPLAGIVDAVETWGTTRPRDLAMALTSLMLVLAGIVLPVVTRWRFLGWMMVPWSAVALVSSDWVWTQGNSTIRAFAPLGIFAALGIARLVRYDYNSVKALRRPHHG